MNRQQQVYDAILLKIDQDEWALESRIPSERSLSESFGVSRSTVREALNTLREQGILKSVTGSGHYVQSKEPDHSSLFDSRITDLTHEELREYRYAIEAQCAYLAAQRATQEQLKKLERAHQHLRYMYRKQDLKAEGLADARFHLAIADASGNRILAQSLKNLFSLLRANVTANISSLSKRPETRLRLMKQHTSLFEAIYHRKPEKARQVAQEHMTFVDRILSENKQL
ncbi:MAG: FadR/GntR family transcriptional regulator [Reinekea sp.]